MKTTTPSITRITSLIASFVWAMAGCGSSSTTPPTPDAHIVAPTPDATPGMTIDAPPGGTIDAPPAAGPDAGLSVKACDPTTQDCADPTQKCTIEDNADGSTATVCLATSGSVGDGGVCTRAGGVVGVDNCAKGFFCSGLGQPTDSTGTAIMRLCRPYCATNTNCTDANQGCINLDGLDPPDGICIPDGCTLIEDTGCATGTTCNFIGLLDGTTTGAPGTYCAPAGTVEAQGDCTSASTHCDVGLYCAPVSDTAAACFQICDDSHPCPANTGTCMPVATGISWPMNAGVCSN